MAIILSDNIKINVGKALDDKYLNGLVPYTNVGVVNSTIPLGIRHIGLTVNVANEEYWYKDGIQDSDLIEKMTASGGTSGLTTLDNIGNGTGEIFSGLSGTSVAQLRTIKGAGTTSVVTLGSEIIIFSSGGTGGQAYTGSSPSNIDAGGMISGTILTGKTLSEIIEDIATTVYLPTLVAPSDGFSDDQIATKEVGITIGTINFTATFDRGLITPAYGTSGLRSGLPNTYNYSGTGLPLTASSPLLTNGQSINNYLVLLGNNIWSVNVDYDAGEQPLKSDGSNYDSPLPAGTSAGSSNTITGIYPWFYGTVNSGTRPIPNQALIDSGNLNKQVASSNGTIAVLNYNAINEWIWFAIPNTSASKTIWAGSNTSSNTGAIGGAVGGSNFIPDPDVVSIQSPDYSTINWSGIDYKIYISNYPSSTFAGGSPYTLTFSNN